MYTDQTRDQFATSTNPQVAAAAFAAAQGAVVGPTRSELGFHVVRVDRVTRVAARPIESARAEITAWLTQRKRADALAALVARADEALYSAKNAGRNRFVVAEASMRAVG